MLALAPEVWGDEENKAPINSCFFIAIQQCGPLTRIKVSKFWNDAATFVQQRSKASVERIGSDLRLIK